MGVWLDLHKTLGKHAHILSGIFIANQAIAEITFKWRLNKQRAWQTFCALSPTVGSNPGVWCCVMKCYDMI